MDSLEKYALRDIYYYDKYYHELYAKQNKWIMI